MKIILIPILVLSVSVLAQDREAAHIEVHEWGVITWDNGSASALGAPLEDIMANAVTRAPVVYFSGPEFSGSFTVSVENGQIIETYPVPENWSTDRCTWTGKFTWDNSLPYIQRELGRYNPTGFSCYEYLDCWRTPEVLTFAGDEGSVEKFLYYESTLDDVTFLPLYPGIQFEYENDRFYDMELLVLCLEDSNLMAAECILGRFACRTAISLDLDMEISEDGSEIRRIFYEWSTDLTDSQMVDALWNTWQAWLMNDAFNENNSDGSNALAIYLMPADLTGNVIFRVVDTDRTSGNQSLDTVSIDELFVRSGEESFSRMSESNPASTNFSRRRCHPARTP